MFSYIELRSLVKQYKLNRNLFEKQSNERIINLMRIDKSSKDTGREFCPREWYDTTAFRLKSGTREFSAGAVFCFLFHGRKRKSTGEVKPRESKP